MCKRVTKVLSDYDYMIIIITILYIIHINVITMIIKYMSKHDFAKKKEQKKITMLYIFRYFKEIRKGIFVIKPMFKIVLRDQFIFYSEVCEDAGLKTLNLFLYCFLSLVVPW